ncbi:hypothetical protein KJ365_04340 [Glaciecola sp. XM2]|jgi:hypothetical protein|uniref:hypothetical protein n=1 Tax=Glaciecola sp. XM2 TaxID=1914931 RepID=UPI001BDE0397|nr:hypothetical protein [Glaciecola sp. XM2]MBT1450098.1 hypothetical protein [Glaciecola sp. XM2]
MSTSVFILSIAICTLFTSIAEAKLIIRGGAGVGLGGGGTIRYLAPVDTGLFQDVNLPTLIQTPGANNELTKAIPFANRALSEVDEAQRCDPSTCEYVFNINDPFSVQGFGDLYGKENGVTASYEWTIFAEGTGTTPGEALISFAATASSLVPGSHVDVFLDTVFPDSLGVGNYEIALTTIYSAPDGFEFGEYDPNLSIFDENGVRFFLWTKIGEQFEFTTQRYGLKLVSAPSVISLFALGLAFILWRKKRT